MANEEQITLIKRGVTVWNQWRSQHDDIIPDLRGVNLSGIYLWGANLWKADLWATDLWSADLREADLSEANLWRTDLRGADLRGTNLSSTDLRRADLRGADLINANLSNADLIEADLRGANLQGANLSAANLWQTDLRGANLKDVFIDDETSLYGKWKQVWQIVNQGVDRLDLAEADLSEANLREANLAGASLMGSELWGTDLSHANLSHADLWGVNLQGADLSHTNLSHADLWRADLREADLSGACLKEANLTGADLSGAQALGTNFERATLTAACIEDWNTNHQTYLYDVICTYVYLKTNQQERCPHDPETTFLSGEFSKLFQKVGETLDMDFEAGIDWKAFWLTLQAVQAQYGADQCMLQTLNQKPNGVLSIGLKVSSGINRIMLLEQMQTAYNTQQQAQALESQNNLHLTPEQIQQQRNHNANLLELLKQLASVRD
jgi:uncharacterized protein YjbI with pentapeptide repeats